jgi:diguanylate cyclase (GGDEF)-like protein
MYLREQLAGRLAAGQRPGVISLDLDGFKPVNDRLGHATGDRVLMETGCRFAELATAPGLFAARPGGDEFVVIVPDGAAVSSDTRHQTFGEALGQTLGEAVVAPIVLDAGTVRVSASLGPAHSEGPDDTVDALLARADRALYEAKEAAREVARRAGINGGG